MGNQKDVPFLPTPQHLLRELEPLNTAEPADMASTEDVESKEEDSEWSDIPTEFTPEEKDALIATLDRELKKEKDNNKQYMSIIRDQGKRIKKLEKELEECRKKRKKG